MQAEGSSKMREIKFRAWDKIADNWVQGESLTISTTGRLLNIPDNIDLMQYTGLKDRAEVEIYEGDIIRSYYQKGVVEYSLGTFGVQVTRDNFLSLLDIWDRGDGHKVEVLGNIYQNPELLEQKD